jgi:hypothetical protein
VFHLNLHAWRRVPRYLLRRRYDAVVFATSFLASRWSPALFEDVQRWAQPLKQLDGVRIALPQDEFLRSATLCDFIDDFDVDVVCSVAPESEWPTIYPTVDFDRVRFTRVLTGYLESRTVERIERIVDETPERPIDIGYRAWEGAPWLGRHGRLKGEIAGAVTAAAPRHDLRLDVSTADEDTLTGDDWFRFLARCRYTIGVEGGASVLDLEGRFFERTTAFRAAHPDASFEEIEAACFPGEEGGVALTALSPRHLEACATRTAQVLVAGSYNGILQPGRHYLELRPDLSNLDDVLAGLRDEGRRREIAQAAYEDVVASGAYGYDRFVDDVLGPALGDAARAPAPPDRAATATLALNRLLDRLTWAYVALQFHVASRLVALRRRLREGR